MLESVLDVSRNLPLKFHQNWVSNIWDILDMDNCFQDICWLNKCYHDTTVGICYRRYQEPTFKVSSNRVSKSWDIADVEFWSNVTWTNVAWSNITFKSVLDGPMNLHLKFHQNWVSNTWDIANIEFVWWGGGCAKSFSCLTQLKVMLGWVELWLSWGFDNIWFDIGFKFWVEFWVHQYLV